MVLIELRKLLDDVNVWLIGSMLFIYVADTKSAIVGYLQLSISLIVTMVTNE